MQLYDTLGIMRNVIEFQRHVVKSSCRRMTKYDIDHQMSRTLLFKGTVESDAERPKQTHNV